MENISLPQEIIDLCLKNQKTGYFDFSTISFSFYKQLLHNLPSLLDKNLENVTFCADLCYSYKNGTNQSLKNYKTIVNSIGYHEPNFMYFISKIASNAFSQAKYLKSVTLQNFQINPTTLSHFLDSCLQVPFLTSITINSVPLLDSSFCFFIQNSSPYQFEALNFINCQISESTYSNIIMFLLKKPENEKNQWKLRQMDLSNNNFSQNQIQHIQSLIKKSGHFSESEIKIEKENVKKFLKANLSDNQNILPFFKNDFFLISPPETPENDLNDSFSDKKEEEETIFDDEFEIKPLLSTEINNNINELFSNNNEKTFEQKITHIRETFGIEKVDLQDPSNMTLKEISEQNKILKTELSQLLKLLDKSKFKDVYIVGNGAKEFVELIQSLEERFQYIEELENQMDSL